MSEGNKGIIKKYIASAKTKTPKIIKYFLWVWGARGQSIIHRLSLFPGMLEPTPVKSEG
jgi:hypothetical protein